MTDDTRLFLTKASNGRRTELAGSITVGRQSDCEVVLTEGHPSRQHARLTVAEGAAWVEDLGSTNGTFVNGRRIDSRVALQPGDRVRFDVEEFVLDAERPAQAGESAKTVLRPPEPSVVTAEGGGARRRPGAWVDPDSIGETANKTRFIDPADLQKMLAGTPAPAVQEEHAPSDAPYLAVSSGSRTGTYIKLQSGAGGRREWTVGCDPAREIVFPDSGVSALHAKIVNDGQRWKLLDQLSANGTFVNGKRSSVSFLNVGDRIRFGPVECIFRLPASAPAGAEQRVRSRTRTVVIAAVSFVVTVVLLYVALQALS